MCTFFETGPADACVTFLSTLLSCSRSEHCLQVKSRVERVAKPILRQATKQRLVAAVPKKASKRPNCISISPLQWQAGCWGRRPLSPKIHSRILSKVWFNLMVVVCNHLLCAHIGRYWLTVCKGGRNLCLPKRPNLHSALQKDTFAFLIVCQLALFRANRVPDPVPKKSAHR